MSWYFREPTLSEILSDLIVKALMNADGVDPIALEDAIPDEDLEDHIVTWPVRMPKRARKRAG